MESEDDMQQLYCTLNTGAKMPLLGLGVYDMYGEVATQAVTYALETGYRLIDTAALYKNEKEVGEGIRRSGIPREEIFLTTKVGNSMQGFDQTMRAFDASSDLLQCEYIDLYLIHWPMPATRRETWRALETLYREGRVRAIGVANYLPPFLNELLNECNIVPALNQVEFSPYLYLQDLLEMCRKNNICLQAYTPLLRGKKFNDPRLVTLALRYQKTPAQILLRWAIQLGVSTIPKSSNPARIRENAELFDFEITEEDMQELARWNENLRVVEDPMMYWT